jgi:ubiquinone/menaquinone biosynthesis C-methylase UbiE
VSTRRLLSHAEAQTVYDRIGRWQETQAFYEKPALDALLAHGSFETASSILEVGCGTGRLAERLLQNQCPSTTRYVGMDLSPRMVAIARARLASFEEQAEIHPTDGSFSFDWPTGSQDRVVATYLLDLLSDADIRSFLAESHRLLGETGRLCLAGLTWGESLLGRVVPHLWSAVHTIRPEWVGGCRPLRMTRFVESGPWRIAHHEVVRSWGVPSEVLIATPT